MFFKRIKEGLSSLKKVFSKTGSLFGDRLRKLFGSPQDPELEEKLRTLFYEADLGPKTADELTKKALARKTNSVEELIEATKQDLLDILTVKNEPVVEHKPHVILIVGVNGSGKTTSIAKLARLYKEEGKRVLLAAADTFRAAAVPQLEHWAHLAGVEIVKGKPQGDPAAVTFDALQAAKARGYDVVIIDTAGRLQNKLDLMQELEKIKRACNKLVPGAPHDTLLVLDANTGQNGIDQATTFHSFTPLSGLILTKLDGSAKGGVIVPVQKAVGVSVKYIGLGEGIADFQPFDPEAFVSALFD